MFKCLNVKWFLSVAAQAHTWRHRWLVTVLHLLTGTFSHFLGPSWTWARIKCTNEHQSSGLGSCGSPSCTDAQHSPLGRTGSSGWELCDKSPESDEKYTYESLWLKHGVTFKPHSRGAWRSGRWLAAQPEGGPRGSSCLSCPSCRCYSGCRLRSRPACMLSYT